MEQVSLSSANRRTRKGRTSSRNTWIEINLNTPSPGSPILTQDMGTKDEQESRRSRIGSLFNPFLTWIYVFSRSVPWISRQNYFVQICVALYVLFSLATFNPFVFYSWISSAGSLELGSYPQLLWTSPPSANTYGIMPTSLLFSKLSPHLGNLAPNAVQIVFDSLKHGSGVRQAELGICVWIPDTHLGTLESWIGLDGHLISALVTTNHLPNSPAFRRLTKDITRVRWRTPRLQGTIVLISTQTAWLSNTNTYINLARLFARTDWVLLVPPTFEPLLPSDTFARTISQLDRQVRIVDSTLLFRLPNNKDRILDGILVPQNLSVWCSERYDISNIGYEWSGCIQDVLSYSPELDAWNSTKRNEGVE